MSDNENKKDNLELTEAEDELLEDDGQEEQSPAVSKASNSDKAPGKAGAKPAAKQKRNPWKRIAKYCKDLKGEFKKINWPTPRVVARNTFVTLVMCAIVGALISAIDFGLGYGVGKLLGLKK